MRIQIDATQPHRTSQTPVQGIVHALQVGKSDIMTTPHDHGSIMSKLQFSHPPGRELVIGDDIAPQAPQLFMHPQRILDRSASVQSPPHAPESSRSVGGTDPPPHMDDSLLVGNSKDGYSGQIRRMAHNEESSLQGPASHPKTMPAVPPRLPFNMAELQCDGCGRFCL